MENKININERKIFREINKMAIAIGIYLIGIFLWLNIIA